MEIRPLPLSRHPATAAMAATQGDEEGGGDQAVSGWLRDNIDRERAGFVVENAFVAASGELDIRKCARRRCVIADEESKFDSIIGYESVDEMAATAGSAEEAADGMAECIGGLGVDRQFPTH